MSGSRDNPRMWLLEFVSPELWLSMARLREAIRTVFNSNAMKSTLFFMHWFIDCIDFHHQLLRSISCSVLWGRWATLPDWNTLPEWKINGNLIHDFIVALQSGWLWQIVVFHQFVGADVPVVYLISVCHHVFIYTRLQTHRRVWMTSALSWSIVQGLCLNRMDDPEFLRLPTFPIMHLDTKLPAAAGTVNNTGFYSVISGVKLWFWFQLWVKLMTRCWYWSRRNNWVNT